MTDDPDLPARVEALEARVAELEARLSRGRPPGHPGLRSSRPRPQAPPGLRVRWAEAKSEDVLGKVGIGLFLLGVLFLLKEAVDRGWLTEAVRVGGAGAIGAALVVVGERLRGSRPILGRLLTGGGIAALFGALWTAGVLYPLLPAFVALAGMAGVAALALVLASREKDAALSVVGTLGALMTPLLLYRDGGQMALLMGYTTVVLTGAALVYWRQGWAALIGAASAGGWGVVLVAWIVGMWPQVADGNLGGEGPAGADRVAFTLGAFAVWGTTSLPAFGRGMREAWEVTPPFASWPSLLRPEALTLLVGALALPLFLVLANDAVSYWMVAAPLAVLFAGGAWQRTAIFGPLVVTTAALAAAIATDILGPSDDRAVAIVTVLGCALVWLGRRESRRDVALVGHAVAMGIGALLVLMLIGTAGFPFEDLSPVTGRRLLDATLAAALGAGALGAIGFTSGRTTAARGFHLTAAHLVVIVWLRLLLGGMENGTALVSGAWGVYGIALVVVGLRLGDDLVRAIGLGTVLLTVAKVLLVDLAEVPALWRIVLFMGLGALLLVVSYFVPSLLRGRTLPTGDGAAEPPLPPPPSVPEPTEAE